MVGDSQTSIAVLKEWVAKFAADRSWEKFHSPKNLATSILIEGAELAEHFQWLTHDESIALAGQAGNQSPIAEELADVISYALAMANVLGVDISTALYHKMQKNAVKYPVQ